MHINSIKKISILAFISCIGAFLVLYAENGHRAINAHGNLLFSAAENIDNVKKIKIETPQNQVTIYQDENLWKIFEADNYYADLNTVRHFLETVSDAKKGREVTQPMPDDQKWITISLYDRQDNKLDSVQLSDPQNVGAHYTRVAENQKIHLTNWKPNIPDTIISWTQHPLIKFDSINIQSLQKNDVKIMRDGKGMTFLDADSKLPHHDYKYMRIFEILTNLWFDNVLSSQEFDESQYPYIQLLKITSFDGLETSMILYSNYEEYWAKIIISTNKLPTREVKNYVENNAYLYEDWWFKLSPEEGRTLFLFKF